MRVGVSGAERRRRGRPEVPDAVGDTASRGPGDQENETSGGCTSVFTVTVRGMRRAGGGTGFSVVRSMEDPSAEYE